MIKSRTIGFRLKCFCPLSAQSRSSCGEKLRAFNIEKHA